MARVTPPNGFATWNAYIAAQVAALVNPTVAQIRQLKKDIKCGMIAGVERKVGGNTASPSYREYNNYTSPGTHAPTAGRPWTK